MHVTTLFKLLLPVLLCLAGPARAEKPPSDSWTFTFRLENDLFADTDRFYTNGIKLNWISPDLNWFRELPWLKKDKALQDKLNRTLEFLPHGRDEDRQRHVSLSVGQMMFTPQDISESGLQVDDRPYAGWLYGSAAFHSKTFRRLDSFEIQAGLTGEWSLAEQAQDLIHSIRGIEKARGWDNQIDTEFAMALVYDHKRRYVADFSKRGHWGLDAIVNTGAALGNVFTHANAGVEFRAGWNLPADFGTSLIRPGGDTSAPADRTDPRYRNRIESLSFHVFVATSGRLVLRDIFLDGNTFSDSHNIGKKTLVGDFVAGASITWKRMKLAYAYVLRSREFDGQPDAQGFGSFSISYTY